MNKKSKTYRTKLSFDKKDFFRSSLQVGMSGISMPLDFKQEMDSAIDIFKDRGQFGMFGGANNMNTFYPGINVPADIIPKPEDFVDVPFRLITATTVGAGSWKATDFSNTGILKASKGKLLEKPIYYDHDTELPNWVGIVKSVKWTEEFTNADGIRVPAGIDAVLAIDAKTNPKIARGVLIGSIFSNSVTVVFDWMPSHTFENMREFDDKIGDMHSDGTMIRRVVTEIHDYYETSLVWLGADPFAKLIDKDGNLRNIDSSSIQYSKEAETTKNLYEKEKKYSVMFGFDKNVLALSRRKTEIDLNKEPMNEKILAQLAALLGVEPKDLTVESLSKFALVDAAKEATNTANAALAAAVNPVLVAYAAEAKLPNPITDVAEFLKTHTFVKPADLVSLKADAAKVPTMEADIVTLKREKSELEADATVGKAFVSMQRAEVKRLYTVHVGADKADAGVLKLIDEAKEDGLEGLLKQYVKDSAMKFSGACKKCGSDEFEFKSSVSTTEETETVDTKSVSFDAIHAKFDKTSMDLSGLKKESK